MKIDLTFDIGDQALSLLHFMNAMERDDDDKFLWTTAPWYNGRERGVCVTCYAPAVRGVGQCLSICWFEHRNSDNICMLKWEHPQSMNPPVTEQAKHIDLAYNGRDKWDSDYSVSYGQIGKAARWISDQFHEWCESHAPKATAE